jgi:hypothetical protein
MDSHGSYSFLAIEAFAQKTTSSSFVKAMDCSSEYGHMAKIKLANDFAVARISSYLSH